MKLLDTVNINKGLADFLQSFFLYCPNRPNNYQMTDIDIMKANFSRYTKRSMYYAENFINNLNNIECELRDRFDFNGEDFKAPIPDSIFFDFDAFIFSCKSIVEGKIKERSKGFHPSVKGDFDKYAKLIFETFVKSYLTPLRNEVAHLNNFGSSMGSMAWIKNGELNIPAFNYSDDLELQRVFNIILIEITSIIKNVATFIMLHECNIWGFPEKDTTFSIGNNIYKISDYITIPSI